MRNIEEIHWHDSEIDSVLELPEKDLLIFKVQYPKDGEQNLFVPMCIVFTGFCSYVISEIPFHGKPTILSATVVVEDPNSPQDKNGYYKIKIETNAGERVVTAQGVVLTDGAKYS